MGKSAEVPNAIKKGIEDAKKNKAMDDMIHDLVARIAKLVED